MMRKLSGWCVTAGVAGAFLLNASGALAQHPDKCQKAIETAAATYEKACTGAIQGCADAVQAAQVKNAALAAASKPVTGTNMVTAAKTCETKLAGMYDYAGAKPGKSAAAKFRIAINKPFTKAPTPDCTAADLSTLNELISGPGGNAPPVGGTPGDFLADWLLLAKEKVCVKEMLFDVPTLVSLINAAVTAPDSTTGTTKPAKGDNTSCDSAAVPPAGTYRPNLCAWGPECYDHACSLATPASNATLTNPALAISLSLSGNQVIEVCKLGPSPFPQDQTSLPPGKPISGLGAGATFGNNPNTLYLINEPSKTISPISATVAGVPIHVCVSGLVSQGWCDCSGQGVHINTAFCQDRTANLVPGPTDACTQQQSAATADASDACDGGACPGTKVGKVGVTGTGASANGDCVDLSTTQFKILMDTDAPNGDRGPDNTACTNDDTVAPAAPAPLPLTTGTASAVVHHAVVVQGNCTGAPNAQCLTDSDCNATTGAAPCVGASFTDVTVGPVTGAKTSCANYESSNLSGLKFVGAFPAAGGKAPTGDSATSFTLVCQ